MKYLIIAVYLLMGRPVNQMAPDTQVSGITYQLTLPNGNQVHGSAGYCFTVYSNYLKETIAK